MALGTRGTVMKSTFTEVMCTSALWWVLYHQALLSPTCSSYPGQVTTDKFRMIWNTGSVLPLSLSGGIGSVIQCKDKAAGNTDNKLKILDLSSKIVLYVYYQEDFFFETQKCLMPWVQSCTHLLYDRGKANVVLREYNSDFYFMLIKQISLSFGASIFLPY